MKNGDVLIYLKKGILVTISDPGSTMSSILYFEEFSLKHEIVNNDLLMDEGDFKSMLREEKINTLI